MYFNEVSALGSSPFSTCSHPLQEYGRATKYSTMKASNSLERRDNGRFNMLQNVIRI